MNNETQRLMESLMLIYGSDLQAATITVLLKDGETGFRFISQTLPQRETQKQVEEIAVIYNKETDSNT